MGKFRKLGSFISSPTAVLVAAVFVAVAVLFLSLSAVEGLEEGDFACSNGSFLLRGTVMNSSFMEATTNVSGLLNRSVNISVYNMSFGSFGGKSLSYVNSTFTNATTGNFSLGIRTLGDPNANAAANTQVDCGQIYLIKVFYYNTSQSSNPNTWVVEEMGPAFPVVPKPALTRFFDNSTIYLQPAATINITAVNQSHNISFNYAIFDDTLGYPVAESFDSKLFNATAVLLRSRNYTIMMMVTPDFTNPGDFSTAAPPQSVAINNISLYNGTNYVVQINKNLSFSQFTIAGNISVVGNTTPVNVSNILVKLSFGGMLPPNSVLSLPNGISISNLSSVLSSSSGSMIANYTTVVMGSGSGIDQVLEFFASNTTSSANNTQYFYAIQNFTVTKSLSSNVTNVTLMQLAGNFSSQTQGGLSVPTSYVRINLTDSTGRPLTEAHTEVTVDNVGNVSGLGPLPQFRYMLDQLSGGVASLPLRLDSNATIKVYSRRYAPLQYKLNLTNASREVNGLIRVTVNTFKPEKRLANGSVDDFSGAKGGNVKVTFMRNTYDCNSPNASVSSCRVGRDFAGGNFDPMAAMFAGKTNVVMELNSTGIILQFLGADMMASGPPDSSMSDSASSSQNGSTLQQAWRFGSVAPKVYDKVLIGVPYNQSLVTENATKINVTLKTLFDDSWNMVWNSSTDNISSVPSEWSDYNQTWFNATRGGMPCVFDIGYNDTNFTQGCIVNTSTNYVWIVLPHFTGGDDNILQSDTTPPAAPTPVNFTATPSGTVMINWTDSSGETGESYIVYRSAFNITNATFGGPGGVYISNYTGINITNLTATTRVPEGVQFFIDNTTLNGSVFFYAVAAVDATGNLQNVTGSQVNISSSPGYNVTVNDTVMPKSIGNLTLTTSDTSVTLTWLNVTQDVSGRSDFYNLTYYVYRSGANESNVFLGNGSNNSPNIAGSNMSFVKTVPGTSNSTTISGHVKGTYHFAVTTADDGGRENVSIFIQGSGPIANYGNISVTPSASSSSSSSSSSSGGGSGGGTPPVSEGVKVSKKWDALPAGTATLGITKAEIGFTTIDFTTSAAASNVEITVTKLANTPTVKRDVQGKVYQYIRIDKVNLREADVPSAKIEFKVEKKWFDQNSGSIKNIVLQRYFNDLWTTLDTTYLRADETHQFFEATSPGLSIFAIVLKTVEEKKAAVNETPVNISGAGSGNESETNATAAGKKAGGAGSNALLVALVIVVMAAIGGGAFFVIKKKGGGGFSFPNPLGRFRRGMGGGKARSKPGEEEEAAEIVKEYEAQRSERVQQQPRQQDQRGRPPEAFN
ncbi:PGF-pre-PGF domain-containing protein [Candidatus Woesearchaeota archaeon]|nr:PGF-pre-PGF domain-containing protein [Candidatus Woesearchaeota archaeon]